MPDLAGGPPLKRPYGKFRGGLPAGWAACGCLLPLWTATPYAYVFFTKTSLSVMADKKEAADRIPSC
jgi:hypothetical protein